MTRLTRGEMITRERMRLQGLSARELAEEVMKYYEEMLDDGKIVACVCCNEDSFPNESGRQNEDWICEDCDARSKSE